MRHLPLTKKIIHVVRAVATKTGYKYYFDQQGGVYIWQKGMLHQQQPSKRMNPQTLKHNRNGGYLFLVSGSRHRGFLLVHRGVALAFPEVCGVPDLLRTQVDHRNNNMYDNRAKNLQWLSPSENSAKRLLRRFRKRNVKEVGKANVKAQSAC